MDTASVIGSGSNGQARWSLRLLGGFELSARPGGEKATALGKRERVLLASLALSPNGRQPRRKLATLLWGDATDETALDNLRTCVWSLRKALGDSEQRLIAREGEDIGLNVAAFEVDALAFRRLAAQSGRVELEEAAKLYAGEFLDGLGIDNEEFESWRREEASRFKDQAADVLARLMAQLADAGETEHAIEAGKRILRLEPLHEAAVRRLMRLYSESGRRGAAVQLYRTLVDALRTELDAQPEAETRAVFAEITRGGEDQPSAPPVAPAKPPPAARPPRPSDASEESPQRALLPTFQSRAPLAIAAGALILVIGLASYQFLAPSTGTGTAQQAGTAPVPSQDAGIAIAVLPFANVSGDVNREFFSDGMTDEISGALAKVPDLRVIARSSAFQFKGQNQDVRAIGQALGVSHLIEGSVRQDGNSVRITAQLVRAGDGVQLWSESFDRDLTDVFAIQEEIAQAIAGALRVPLGLRQGESLVPSRATNLDTYQDYLRAKALVRQRGRAEPGPLTEATQLLEQVVARDPEYAPAWALLGQAYALIPAYSPEHSNGSADELRRVVEASFPKAEAAAERAIRLAPNSADGYVALAYLGYFRGEFVEAENLSKRALSLDPANPDALNAHSSQLLFSGRTREALSLRQRLRALEPFVPIYNVFAAQALWLNGQTEAAFAILETLPPIRGVSFIYASEGRYREAADVLSKMPPGSYQDQIRDTAVRLLRTAPARAPSPQTLPRLGELSFVFLYVGAPDRFLEPMESDVSAGFFATNYNASIWHRSAAALRKTDRFKAYIRKAGLFDYWRANGWPDLCRPVGADDFVCD